VGLLQFLLGYGHMYKDQTVFCDPLRCLSQFCALLLRKFGTTQHIDLVLEFSCVLIFGIERGVAEWRAVIDSRDQQLRSAWLIMSAGSLIDQAKAAISALAHPAETHRANEWLVEFERSPSAWEVSDALVREEHGSYRFFGAKFLYSKVQKQFIQLDANSVNMLTQSLVQHILRIGQEKNVEFNVCRYLCLALAALALQMNQSGILTQILQWLNPIISSNPNVLLELLIVLPEEAYNYQIDIGSSARSGFIRQLTDSANDVLSFLSSLWPSVGPAVQAKILTCSAKWIDTTSLPSDMLVRNPMYMYILHNLESTHDETFESAVDAVIVIFQRFRTSDSRILDSSLPSILNLRSRWRNRMHVIGNATGDDVDDEDRNACRALCRLFTETAEAVIDIFLNAGTTLPWTAELLQQLLECTRAHFDPSISRIPLKFFYDLAMSVRLQPEEGDQWSANNSNSALNEAVSETGDSRSNSAKHSDAARKELNARYTPVYQHLFDIALGHLLLPTAVLESPTAIPEDWSDKRAEWKETILDCCCVLGGTPCMDILCKHLQQLSDMSSNGAAHAQWNQLESVLLAMQTVVPFLTRDEAQYTPLVLHYVSALPDKLPVQLRITAIELLGKYSFWLAANPAAVHDVLNRLFSDLQHKSTCAVAARALMNVLRTCSHLPGLPVQDLHQAVVHMRAQAESHGGTAILSLESELHLLEAIMSVLSQLPATESEAGFKMVLMPVVTSLAHGLQHASQGNVSSNAFTPHVDRITVLFQCYRCPGQSTFLVELFVQVLPLYQRLLELCPTERVSEKCCRCYKHALRTLGKAFVPYLSVMTTHLADQFARTPYAAFLYGCSTCFSTFSLLDNGAHVETLYSMLWKVSHTFFSTHPTLHHFEQKPDVVEEYFFLMAKALQYCPAPFLNYPAEASTVVQAGLVGLSLRHREAQKGILLFFERFVQLSTFWPDETRGSAGAIGTTSGQAPSTNPLNLAAKALVQQHGAALLAKIFALLSGEMTAYALDESNGCISDVLWYMKKRYKDEFQVGSRSCVYDVVSCDVSERLCGIAFGSAQISVVHCNCDDDGCCDAFTGMAEGSAAGPECHRAERGRHAAAGGSAGCLQVTPGV
jgi:transportin-3